MNPRWVFTLLWLAEILSVGGVIAAPRFGKNEAVALLEAVRAVKPAEDRAVVVRKAQIVMGPATLVIEEGVLVPSSPVGGHLLEVSFTGDAVFRFATSDPVESGQLELFTGDSSLLTAVTQAVLVTGDEKVFQRLLAGEHAADERVRDASKLFTNWLQQPERQGFAADLAMVKALFGDDRFSGYFAVWCRSPDHGDFYYVVNPSEAEPVSLGQFVPMDMGRLDVWQQRRIKNFLHDVKFFGRFSNFGMEHPGDWDTWVSLPSADAHAPTSAVEPEHYVIDAYFNPSIELDARCSAKVRLRAGSAAVRTIAFRLSSGVKVTGVYGPDGAPIDFVRREAALHVFLDVPLPAKETLEIRVEYEGDLVHVLDKDKSYLLLDTESWYPRTGDTDRATYEVTLRRPKRIGVLASGHVVQSGEENDVAWERRVLDLPALGFTFELGHFDITKDRAGHVELTFGFQGGVDVWESEERGKVIETAKRALAFFEEKFGPYPLDYLTVATADRGFSQGMLSMVTLANAAIRPPGERLLPRERERAEEQATLTIAHEVSHQWWGNWVGWSSYRDQWLSEALASYAALYYGMEIATSRPAFLARNALDWDSALSATSSEGRSVGSLGPITLGLRLTSSKSSHAYGAIVYEKGQVVFRMLARSLGEDLFPKMLGELARAVANQTIDTATFLRALEKMSGQDLGPFAQQYIHGTGIPEVYYQYSFQEKEDGKGWVIRGNARQVADRVESLRVAQDEKGTWLLDRRVKVDTEVPRLPLIVPFQVILTPPAVVKKGTSGTVQRGRGFGGRVVLRGFETPFEFTVPEKPERFELDQLGEVLCLFHDVGWMPKRTLHLQAADIEASGDFQSAEALLRKALVAPVYSEHALAWVRPDEKKAQQAFNDRVATFEKLENARIHTLLAKFLTDRGDLKAAETEIVAAEALLEKPDSEGGSMDRRILRSRIDLARGDGESAYLRLQRVSATRWLGADGFAVLAMAANLAGHDRSAEQALRKAEERGVDVRALRNSRAAGAAGPDR